VNCSSISIISDINRVPLSQDLLKTRIPSSNGVLEGVKPRDFKANLAKLIQRVREFVARLQISFAKLLTAVIPAITQRIKEGEIFTFKFQGSEEELKQLAPLFNFTDYDGKLPQDKSPLSNIQREAAMSLVKRLINARENAIKIKRGEEIKCEPPELTCEQIELEIRKFHKLLEKSQPTYATRFDFRIKEWEAFDRVNFDIVTKYSENLCELFNSNLLNDIQEKMDEQFGVDYKEALVSEMLAKSVAYILNLNGKTLNLPVQGKGGVYQSIEYEIREFNLGDALPCYVLEKKASESKDSSVSAKPWLVLRGTEGVTRKSKKGIEFRKGSTESLCANLLDSKGLATDPVIKSIVRPEDSLAALFKGWEKKGLRVNLAGHSLGGYFANDVAVRFPDQTNTAYAFSAPAVSEELAEKWNAFVEGACKNVEKSKDKPSFRAELERKIVNFDVEGDMIPVAGRNLIGLHLAIAPVAKPKMNDPIHNHGKNYLTQDFTLQKINNEQESRKTVRRGMEGLRALGARVQGYLYFGKKLPDWWVNRHTYHRLYSTLSNVN